MGVIAPFVEDIAPERAGQQGKEGKAGGGPEGIESFRGEAAREAGALFENLIFHHLKVLAGMFTPKLRLYYWRTMKGKEVDFVLEWGRKIVAVEVKLTCSPRYADCEGLEAFLKDHPEASGGILIHIGRDVVRLGTKIVALPWTALAGA